MDENKKMNENNQEKERKKADLKPNDELHNCPNNDLLNTTYIIDRNAIKPCSILQYCPYGILVEAFRIRHSLKNGSKYSCELFGHDCPIFYLVEYVNNNKELMFPYIDMMKDIDNELLIDLKQIQTNKKLNKREKYLKTLEIVKEVFSIK